MPIQPSRSPCRRKRLSIVPLGIFVGLHLCITPPAFAQETSSAETYTADFFRQFSPQTALDMVQHLPGFRLDTGDEGRRGYSDAAGNAFVDGQQPAGKSGGIAAALAAIPARKVARIEILRGAVAPGVQSGQGAFANIVTSGVGDSRTASAGLSMMRGFVRGNASLSVSVVLGQFNLTSRTVFDGDGEHSHGTRRSFDAGGTRTRAQELVYRTAFPEISQRMTLTGPFVGGRVTAAAMLTRARLSETFVFLDEAGLERNPKRTKRWRGEIGADWGREIAPDYRLKVLALTRFTDLNGASSSQFGTDGDALQSAIRLESESLSRETVLHATLTKGSNAEWQPNLGVEIAWNSLASRTALVDPRGGGAVSSLPGADILVSERRVNAFATLGWRPAPRWSIEGGIAYEISRISALGDALGKNSFGFFKPKMTISFAPDRLTSLRLAVARNVGQLSFDNFAASVNLAAATATGGNPDLGPDDRSTASLHFHQGFGKRGAITFSASHDWRKDVLEAAILPSGVFGVTNVARARAWGITTSLELPIDSYVRGGLLTLRHSRRWSRVADPVTGDHRTLNDTRPSTFTASFRQDLVDRELAWGFEYSKGYRTWLWFANEAREQHRHQEIGLFVETTRLLDAKMRLELTGLTGRRNNFRRLLHAPNRAHPFAGSELWDIRTPATISLSASRSF